MESVGKVEVKKTQINKNEKLNYPDLIVLLKL